MQNPKHTARLIIILIVLLFAGMGAIYTYNTIRYSKMGKLSTNLAPSDSILKLNGKRVKGNRLLYLTPGSYKWELSRVDFETKKGDFTVKKGEEKSLDLYLQATGAAGERWLQANPEESYRIEGAVGRRFDELAAQALAETPIIGELPFTAPGEEFSINYGSGTVNGKPKTTIFIKFTSEEAKTSALEWIKDQGTNPATLTIEYTQIEPKQFIDSGQWDE